MRMGAYFNDVFCGKEVHMSNSTIGLLIVVGIIVLLLAGIVSIFVSKDKKKLRRSGSYASMVAFHDMQPKDKQKAIEIVMEQKEQMKWKEEKSGKDFTDGTD
jgi:hypothetical protein